MVNCSGGQAGRLSSGIGGRNIGLGGKKIPAKAAALVSAVS